MQRFKEERLPKGNSAGGGKAVGLNENGQPRKAEGKACEKPAPIPHDGRGDPNTRREFEKGTEKRTGELTGNKLSRKGTENGEEHDISAKGKDRSGGRRNRFRKGTNGGFCGGLCRFPHG